jgi:hypothetical protein
MVKLAAPAVTLVGEMDTNVGTGLLPTGVIVKFNAFEVPPPGAGVTTVTGAVPATATSDEFTVAVNCNPFTNVVARAVPFQLMTELLMKLVPFTVSVNVAAPAVTLAGEREPIVGTGLVAIVPIVNIAVLEVPPPGVPLKTFTLAVPAVATNGSLTLAVNCVALT